MENAKTDVTSNQAASAASSAASQQAQPDYFDAQAETFDEVTGLNTAETATGQDSTHTETATSSHASGHAGPESLPALLNQSNVVSVLIVVVFLAWVVKKFGIFQKVEDHRNSIARDLQALSADRQRAQEDLDALRKRTAGLQKEVDAVLAEARDSASRMAEQIVSDAESDAQKLMEAAERRIQSEEKAAVRQLEARLLNDAIQTARENLVNSLKKTDQKRSVETFLDELVEA